MSRVCMYLQIRLIHVVLIKGYTYFLNMDKS